MSSFVPTNYDLLCFEWFKKSKSGNFDVKNEDRGKPPKKFEDWDQKGVIYYELLKHGETSFIGVAFITFRRGGKNV